MEAGRNFQWILALDNCLWKNPPMDQCKHVLRMYSTLGYLVSCATPLFFQLIYWVLVLTKSFGLGRLAIGP